MVALAYITFFGVPLLAAFWILANRGSATAVSASIVGGWLTMPLLTVDLRGFPDLDKAALLPMVVAMATWVARRNKAPRPRLRWFDAPILVWCLVPIATSVSNDLGLYDGCATSLRQVLVWGAPYVLGRLLFVDRGALTCFARILLLGAAAYAPLCLLESRLGPQLHLWVFGMPGRVGWETADFYGPLKWKASVFLQSPLELTTLMGFAFLYGWCLTFQAGRASHAGYPVKPMAWGALFATLMGKSLGGVTLTMVGICVLWLGRRFGTRALIVLLLAIAPTYIVTRVTGLWSGESLVQFVAEQASTRRAESLQFRMMNEDQLAAKALEQPLLGWGGWGRNAVYNEEAQTFSVTDGLWVIAFGCHGLIGLSAYFAMLLLPVAIVVARLRAREAWLDPRNAVVVASATILALHSIDCLANAMPGPIYYMLAGGVCTALGPDQPRRSLVASGVLTKRR